MSSQEKTPKSSPGRNARLQSRRKRSAAKLPITQRRPEPPKCQRFSYPPPEPRVQWQQGDTVQVNYIRHFSPRADPSALQGKWQRGTISSVNPDDGTYAVKVIDKKGHSDTYENVDPFNINQPPKVGRPCTKKPDVDKGPNACSCDGCKAPDCGECWACKGKQKFGGSGRTRKKCRRRKCLNKDGAPEVRCNCGQSWCAADLRKSGQLSFSFKEGNESGEANFVRICSAIRGTSSRAVLNDLLTKKFASFSAVHFFPIDLVADKRGVGLKDRKEFFRDPRFRSQQEIESDARCPPNADLQGHVADFAMLPHNELAREAARLKVELALTKDELEHTKQDLAEAKASLYVPNESLPHNEEIALL